MRWCARAAFVLALAGGGAAQAGDNQIWTSATISGPLHAEKPLLVSLEGQARWREDGSELEVTSIRPSVGWRVSPKLDLWLGYVHNTLNREPEDLTEHRVFQQASVNAGDWAGGRVTLRTRLEQRWREGGDDMGLRLRQQVRYTRPIGETPLSWVVSDEVFFTLNDTDWGQEAGLDQNRLFLGAAWQASKKARVDAGYLNQRVNGTRGASDRTNHVAQVTLALSL